MRQESLGRNLGRGPSTFQKRADTKKGKGKGRKEAKKKERPSTPREFCRNLQTLSSTKYNRLARVRIRKIAIKSRAREEKVESRNQERKHLEIKVFLNCVFTDHGKHAEAQRKTLNHIVKGVKWSKWER